MDSNAAFQCSSCNFVSMSFKSHLVHQKQHRHINVLHQCGLGGCKYKCNSEGTLRLHLIRNHNYFVSQVKKVLTERNSSQFPVSSNAKFKCSVSFCGKEFLYHNHLTTHFKVHLKAGLRIPCPFSNCLKDFASLHSLSGHTSKHRRKQTEDVNVSVCENVEELPHIENSEVLDYISSQCSPEQQLSPTVNPLLLSLAQFYLRLECKYFIPESTVQYIAEELKYLLIDSEGCFIQGLEKALRAEGLHQEKISYIAACIKDEWNMPQHLCDLRSIYKRKEFYKSTFSYVEPKEIAIGDGKSFYYVPIQDSIKSLYTNKSFNFSVNPGTMSNDDVLHDFTDGEVFKTNSFFKENPSALKLILYQDAFEMVCPIGPAKSNNHKILGIYMALGDLPAHERFQKENIHLVALCKEKDFSHHKVYGKMVNDILDLQENGVEVPHVGKVKAGVVFVAGDNLGSHSLAGLVENFSKSKYICRNCLAQRNEFHQEGGEVRQFPKRTVHSYNAAVKKVEILKRKKSSCKSLSYEGVKFDSEFNKIKGFHVCAPGLPPCLGHDLFEGVVAYDLKLYVKYFVEKQWFSLSELNTLIESFPYSQEDGRDKPCIITSIDQKKLTGSASQVWTLLRLFPLIVFTRIKNTQDPVWQNLLQLSEIVQICTSPEIHRSQLPYLKNIIDEYLITRKELFNDIPLKPKHHFLSEYVEHILNYGPLIKVWTMRFESKHTFFKRCWKATRSSVNVLFTLSQKHELLQCLVRCGLNARLTVVTGERTEFLTQLYSVHILNAILSSTQISGLQECNFAIIKGTKYRKGYVVVLRLNSCSFEESLEIGVITLILIDTHENCKFLVRKGNAKLQLGYNAFKVKMNDNFECIDSSMLLTYYPLSLYVRNTSSFLTLKYGLVKEKVVF